MPDTTIPISIEATSNVGAGLSQAQSQIQQFAAATQSGFAGATAGTEALTASLIKMGAQFVSVTALAHTFLDALKEAASQQQSMLLLQRSIENLGVAFQSVSAEVTQTVQHISDFTRFAANDARQAIENLVITTGSYQKAMESLQLVQDMAVFRGTTLAEMAQKFGMGIEGNTRVLREFGIVLDAATQANFRAGTEAQRLAFLTEALGGKVQGLTQVDAASWATKWAIAMHQLNEALATAGTFFLDLLGKMDKFFAMWDLHNKMIDLAKAAGFNNLAAGLTPTISSEAGGSLVSNQPGTPGTFLGFSGAAATKALAAAMLPDEAALREAARLTQLYADTLNKLLGISKDAATTQRALAEALRLAAAGYQVDAQAIDSMLQAQARAQAPGFLGSLPTSLGGVMGGMTGITQQQTNAMSAFLLGPEFFKKLQDGVFTSFDQAMKAAIDDSQAVLDDAAQQQAMLWLEEMQKNSKLVAADFAHNIQLPLEAVFHDLAVTGGQNIGKILGESAKTAFGDFASFIGRLFVSAFGGGGGVTQLPGPNGTTISTAPGFFGPGGTGTGLAGQATAQGAVNQQNQLAQDTINNLLKGIGGILALSQIAITPGAGPLQGIVTGAAAGGALGAAAAAGGSIIAGATVGSAWPIIGTIIGAVVGALIGIFAPAKGADYPAVNDVALVGGRAVVGQGQNVAQTSLDKVRIQIQDSFDAIAGGFQAILFSLQAPLLNLAKFSITPTRGDVNQPGIDLNTGQNPKILQEIQDWASGNLPKEIAKQFFAPLAAAFKDYGISGDAFKGLWDTLQQMDPKKALDMLTAFASGTLQIFNALKFMGTPSGFGSSGGGFDYWSSLRGQAITDAQSGPVGLISKGMQLIIDTAKSLVNLPIEQQVAGWKGIGDAMTAVQQSELDFIKQLNAAVTSISASFNAQISGFKLAGMVDAQGKPIVKDQLAFLNQQAALLYSQIGTAPDVSTATNISQQIQALIGQIVQLGGSQSPAAMAAFLKWGEAAAAQARDALVTRLNVLGQQLDAANAGFIAAFKAAQDAFTASLAASGNSTANLGASANAAGFEIHGMAEAAQIATDALHGLAAAAGGGDAVSTTVIHRTAAMT